MSEYINDILQQPVALRDTLAGLDDFSSLRPLATQVASGQISRVVLTGMGSSFWALHPLYLALLAHGVTAYLMETSELIHHAPSLLNDRSLVLAVSQSGQSAEIVRLVERKNGPLLAVTNTPDSPLAQQADEVVLTHAGAESAVSCKTYVTALAALALVRAVLTGADLARTRSELDAAPEAAAAYLANWQAYVEAISQRVANTQYVIVTGRGTSLAAAGTAGLIIKESAHFPAEGMSGAAFRHGPLEMTWPNLFVLVYEGGEPTRALNHRLVSDIRAAGGEAELVIEAAPAEDVFTLPFTSGTVRPILEILPAQLLSLALARKRGHEAGHFVLGTKITATE